MYLRVAPDIPKLNQTYWYSCDEKIKGYQAITRGSVVRIPLHGRRVRGWVLECAHDAPALTLRDGSALDVSKIKSIIEYVSDGPPAHLVEFAHKLSRHYLTSKVTFLRAMSPTRIMRTISYASHETGAGAQSKLIVVDPRADRRAFIHEHIAQSGSTIIITPDSHERIATWAKELSHRTIEYHHDDKNKDNSYLQASHNNCVIVGGRVALFAPVTDCQSIIILDDAYEQLSEERSPRWNVSHCAQIASEMWKIPLTFISSVPSAATKDLDIVDERTSRPWPSVLIENRNNADPALGVFTRSIVTAITKALESGNDAAVILNNTVNARLVVCRSCDTVATCATCEHCVHQDDSETNPLVCPTCATRRPLLCLSCGGTTFKKYRRGLSSVAKDCAALFSKHRVVELSKLHSVPTNTSGQPTLYVATEAIFHRPELTKSLACCIFIDIDSMMFRSGMGAFEQTLVVVNRALRILKKRDLANPVILATRSPDNILLKEIVDGDFVSNRDRELALRQQLRLAPYYATVEVTASTPAIEKMVKDIPSSIVGGTKKEKENTSVLLRAKNHEELTDQAYSAINALRLNHRCTLSVDAYD